MRKQRIIQISIDGILALIGLGDLFVPEIKSWIFAGIIWGVALIWAIFIIVFWVKDRKKKQLESIKLNENQESQKELILGARVEKIITYVNGTKNLTVNIKLVPAMPVTVDILSLYLWGEKYEAKKWQEHENKPYALINITPFTITDPKSYTVFFDVPKESVINSEDVKIYAFANGKEFLSEPFGIKFEASI